MKRLKKSNNVIAALTAAVILIFPTVYAEEDVSFSDMTYTTGEILTHYIDSTGKCEIMGYFDEPSDSVAEYGAPMVMTDGVSVKEAFEADDLSEHIMYLAQSRLGNNNTFYYRFQLDEKWSRSPYATYIQGGTMLTSEGIIREIPSQIYNIANNAIRIGNDVYDLGCPQYTPENVAASIARGGNKIYYKIGDLWFDMLADEAVASSYFAIANAVPAPEWDTWEIDNYYKYGGWL